MKIIKIERKGNSICVHFDNLDSASFPAENVKDKADLLAKVQEWKTEMEKDPLPSGDLAIYKQLEGEVL